MVRAHLPTLSCTQSISRPGILTGIETVGDRELESRWQRQLFGIWCAIRRTSRAPRELLTAVHTNVFNLWFVLVTDFFFSVIETQNCVFWTNSAVIQRKLATGCGSGRSFTNTTLSFYTTRGIIIIIIISFKLIFLWHKWQTFRTVWQSDPPVSAPWHLRA